MKNDVIKEQKNIQPHFVALLPNNSAALEKILDDLKLDQLCCRARIMTNVEFESIY